MQSKTSSEQPLTLQLHNIPESLRDRHQWILWREETRDGDPTKAPRKIDNSGYAKTSDSATWGSFEDARRAFESGLCDGIGFVFTGNDPFVGVDLDNAVTDGSLTGGAWDVVNRLDSYTEGSPSGTGLHIICRGSLLPSAGNRSGDVPGMKELEIYEDGRYFTFTGRHLDGTPETVEDRESELHALCEDHFGASESEDTAEDSEPESPESGSSESPSSTPSTPNNLDDRELIEKAKEADDSGKFEALWSGDTSGYTSHSEADQALVNKLAFWTGGDRAQIERLFADSGLCRPKWTERADYRETTIDAALEEVEEFYDPSSTEERVEEIVEQIEEDDAGAELVFDNLDAFARLDAAALATAKEKVSDVVNLNDFTRGVRETQRELEREDFEGKSDLPAIQLSGRPGREIVDEATDALHDWNDPPELFQRGTEPVQIATDEQGMPVVRELPDAVLDDCLDRAADFFRTSQKRGAIREDLSKRYVERIRETIELPPLEGIVEVPVLRPDGSILREPGYDEDSRLFYKPDDQLTAPEIPDAPTDEEVRRAVETIWTPLQDFPFVDRASKANALALMLTPIVRPYLGGQNVPLSLVDATVQGTGKSLFVDVLSIISTGRPAGTMSAPDSDEEWRKQITAQLLQGASMIVVDNVRGRLQSAPLEQAITTSLWQDRVLGKSRQVEIPQRATWVATGNNVQPKGDMKRRVYPIRMDAEMERPWMGREFEIDNLEQWTKDHRGELVSALLTLARSWFAEGKPRPDVELLGSFEAWTRTVGGILEHAGVESFLDNLGELYEHMDQETTEWAGFLEALHTYFRGEVESGEREAPTFTSKELGRIIRDNYRKDPDFRGAHVRAIIDTLPDYVLKKLNRGDPISRTLGNMFAHRRGRRFGSEQWRVEVASTRDRTKHWTVRRKQPQGDVKNESNESSITSRGHDPPHPSDKVGGGHSQNGVEPDSLDSSSGGDSTDSDTEAPF